ncbi:MAG: prolipoprotein diacylglyceryl transferase, partial [Deltaproteobacteria bacterium]|nr:prolipoprotein diacylglyceryl transferase [Deltaproteobacteria bacterium]
MHPILIKIGNISLYTYGLFIALAFLTAISLAQKEARRYGANSSQITDLGFFILIAAIVGSRILYLIINPELMAQDPWEAFRLWNGGLVFYGGFIAAVITAAIYMRKKKMPLWQTTDIFAPALAAGHALGRIGCFFAGCCYGRACDLPWAVTFSHPDTLAPSGIALHPAQLYASACNL